MANRIVVDPITRIEGHLRAEVEITEMEPSETHSFHQGWYVV